MREIAIPNYVYTPAPAAHKPLLLFDGVSRDTLLSYGVPGEWTDDVLAATEDTLFGILDHIPQEAAESLMTLATGGTPVAAVTSDHTSPFEHPDAQRRFRVMNNVEELERALEFPWEKWSVFLHPSQRELVERHFNGPARVAGSAGTGKTVVALHRAVHLARSHPDARVLVTTFSVTLARMLRQKLLRLVGDDNKLAQRITVETVDDVAITLYEKSFGTPRMATPGMLESLLATLSREGAEHAFTDRFLLQEWTDVVDAWQLTTWEEYRDVARLGRKTRLGEKQRKILWKIFAKARQRLIEGALFTPPMIFAALDPRHLGADRNPRERGGPVSSRDSLDSRFRGNDEGGRANDDGGVAFDFVVVDEAQDVNVPQLRFLAALAGSRPNGLFFAGDLGQRIFQTPFSWKSLGVDVRGRSSTLRINYRTSHQIRRQADRLLAPEIADVDGNVESRGGTISVFNGPEPDIRLFPTAEAETKAIGAWIGERIAEGMVPNEIVVFVRSSAELPRARNAIAAAGLGVTIPAIGVDPEPGKVVLMPMHLAKGLEFRAVVMACCDDEVVPLQSRIEQVTDDSDLEEVYNTERQLLYVACTRARDRLLVTGVNPGSEFLADMTAR